MAYPWRKTRSFSVLLSTNISNLPTLAFHDALEGLKCGDLRMETIYWQLIQLSPFIRASEYVYPAAPDFHRPKTLLAAIENRSYRVVH